MEYCREQRVLLSMFTTVTLRVCATSLPHQTNGLTPLAERTLDRKFLDIRNIAFADVVRQQRQYSLSRGIVMH